MWSAVGMGTPLGRCGVLWQFMGLVRGSTGACGKTESVMGAHGWTGGRRCGVAWMDRARGAVGVQGWDTVCRGGAWAMAASGEVKGAEGDTGRLRCYGRVGRRKALRVKASAG